MSTNKTVIYKWDSPWDKKTIYHLMGCVAGFLAVFYLVRWMNLEEMLQLPKLFAGVCVFLVAYMVEYVQMKISKGVISLTDLTVALVAIVTTALLVK